MYNHWMGYPDHKPWHERFELIQRLRDCWLVGGTYPLSRRLENKIILDRCHGDKYHAAKHPEWHTLHLKQRNQE